MNNFDRFSDVKKVAVIGGTIDSSGNLNEEIRICSVIQVGEDDIFVAEESSRYGGAPVIVPKSLCIPLHTSYEVVAAAQPTQPELGDLVFYSGKLDWKDKTVSQLAGILCEIRYRIGVRHLGRILIDGEMKEVDYSRLLVLQKKQ